MSLLLFKTNRKCLNAASSLLKLVTWKFGSLVVGIAGHCPGIFHALNASLAGLIYGTRVSLCEKAIGSGPADEVGI